MFQTLDSGLGPSKSCCSLFLEVPWAFLILEVWKILDMNGLSQPRFETKFNEMVTICHNRVPLYRLNLLKYSKSPMGSRFGNSPMQGWRYLETSAGSRSLGILLVLFQGFFIGIHRYKNIQRPPVEGAANPWVSQTSEMPGVRRKWHT